MKKESKNLKSLRVAKIALLVAVMSMLAVSIVSCKFPFGLVRGSGNIETETVEVSGFNEVHIIGIGNLIIEQGGEESLVIEADDNILPLIEAEVSGDTLTIGIKRGFNFIPASKIKFYLTVIDLDNILLSGAGDIDGKKFNTDTLEFEISGTGDIDFNINADKVETRSSGAGSITLSGKVDIQEIEISGLGKYDAEELESRKCEIVISGAGTATVNVSELLDINISGAGNVYYTGEPKIDQNVSGIGRIRRLD